MVNNRKSNTYYPTIAEVYRNGLREVKSVADCDNLKDRLQEKITREAKEHSAMIQSFGVAMTPPIDYEDIKKQVSDLGVNDFESGYKGLFLIPIVLDDTINKLVDDSKSFRSPMMNLLSQIEKIDDKGAKVGFTRGDDALINNARRFCRERTIALIKSIKHVMDIHKKTDRDFIFALIQNLNSRFIPDDRKYIYAEGIYRGFNNDYISAAHLLLPQFENSFRYIASQNGINTTKWTEELEHQNVFGGSLEKMKGLSKGNLYKELHNFLADTSSVNFRNELCHGLMSPILIEYYGLYLWWLTLKLVFQTEYYFSFRNSH